MMGPEWDSWVCSHEMYTLYTRRLNNHKQQGCDFKLKLSCLQIPDYVGLRNAGGLHLKQKCLIYHQLLQSTMFC